MKRLRFEDITDDFIIGLVYDYIVDQCPWMPIERTPTGVACLPEDADFLRQVRYRIIEGLSEVAA